MSRQMDRDAWPAMKERFAGVFAAKTRKEWEAIFEGSDACAAPVLSPAEAPDHPHISSGRRSPRSPAWSSRLRRPGSRAPRAPIRRPPPNPGQHGDEALVEWGLDEVEVSALRQSGAIS